MTGETAKPNATTIAARTKGMICLDIFSIGSPDTPTTANRLVPTGGVKRPIIKVVIATIATLVPALRATSVDPGDVLREP